MKWLKNKKIVGVMVVALIGVTVLFTGGKVAYADGIKLDCSDHSFLGIPAWYNGTCGTEYSNIGDFIKIVLPNIIRILFGALGLVSFAFIIISGFQMMIAQGDRGRVAAAQSTLIKAIAGLIIGIAANAIVKFIGDAVNLDTGSISLGDFLPVKNAAALDTSFLDKLPNNPDDGSVIKNLLPLAYSVAGMIAVGMVAYSGIKYMLSGGNPGKTAEATQSLIWSLAGLAVVILASAIISFVVTNITGTDINQLAANAIKQIFFFGGIVAVIMIVFSGLRYVTSTGDPGRARAAMSTLVYAIVGLVVCLLAYVIIGFVTSLL